MAVFNYICTLFDKRWGVAAVSWLRQSLFFGHLICEASKLKYIHNQLHTNKIKPA